MIVISENSGIQCIKFSLIFFTVILFITGVSLIIVGSTINEIFVEFSNFLTSVYFSPASVIVFVGFVIFGIACLGCVGAFKESVCIIMTFGVLLGITAFLQLCAGFTNNILMTEIDREINFSINRTMLSYRVDDSAQEAMDKLQQELHCCGLNGPKDWLYESTGSSIPESCCSHYTNGTCDNAFNGGCYIALKSIVKNSSRILTASAYLLAFTQVLGMMFAFYLGKMLRAQKLARDYRRWAIRNQLLNNITYDSCYIPFNPFHNEKPVDKDSPTQKMY